MIGLHGARALPSIPGCDTADIEHQAGIRDDIVSDLFLPTTNRHRVVARCSLTKDDTSDARTDSVAPALGVGRELLARWAYSVGA